MQIIGPEPANPADDAIHTIDVWFSEGQRRWIVQRLNANGDAIGPSHKCRSRGEATSCVADWMRRHPETHLTTPHERQVGKARGGQARRA